MPEPAIASKETWTVQQLARHIDLSESTVRRLVADGLIPHQPSGRDERSRRLPLYFSAADVAAMGAGRPAAEIQNRKNWRAVKNGLREFGPDMWAQPSVTIGPVGDRKVRRHLPGQPIFDLSDAAGARRAARKRLVDARARWGPRAPQLRRPRLAHDDATARWVRCLSAAAEVGYPPRSLAGPAGVSVASVVNRLRQLERGPSSS